MRLVSAAVAVVTTQCVLLDFVNASPLLVDRRVPNILTIDSGYIIGDTVSPTATPNGGPQAVNHYLGIPFATVPQRFEPAVNVKPWVGIYDAQRYRPSCMQEFKYPVQNRLQQLAWFNTPPPPVEDAEDCLTLNIWAPVNATGGSKAVMFWLYGGGFNFGSGALPLYNGANMAANQDVVVVTSNYRLNVFGFPGSPAIDKTKQNLGFFDQRMALDWVQRNIHVFGGDPKRVTIFGQSAGSGSVDNLITAPPEPVPFAAAIEQSGQGSLYIPNHDSADSWKKLAKATGCAMKPAMKELECVRRVPAPQLRSLIEHEALTFGPIQDGVTWLTKPRSARLKSTATNPRIARVPVLMGSNADEGSTFQFGKSKADQQSYTLSSFQCPAAVVAGDSADVGIPTWRYYYNASYPNQDLFQGSGAYHSAEVGLIFGTYPRIGATDTQKKMSALLQKAWTDFAKDPTRGPGWQEVPQVAVFNDDVSAAIPTVDAAKTIDKDCGRFELLYGVVGIFE